jgi:hypothetical protein
MRWVLFVAFIALLNDSCTKDAASTTLLQERVDTTIAEEKSGGLFMNGPFGSVSGSVKIYNQDGLFLVALAGMVISNGPDLHVYLSKEQQPVHFIDLGKLKSTSGDQVYPVKTAPDFSQYKYVLIHCQKYNHLFGSAEIAP